MLNTIYKETCWASCLGEQIAPFPNGTTIGIGENSIF